METISDQIKEMLLESIKENPKVNLFTIAHKILDNHLPFEILKEEISKLSKENIIKAMKEIHISGIKKNDTIENLVNTMIDFLEKRTVDVFLNHEKNESHIPKKNGGKNGMKKEKYDFEHMLYGYERVEDKEFLNEEEYKQKILQILEDQNEETKNAIAEEEEKELVNIPEIYVYKVMSELLFQNIDSIDLNNQQKKFVQTKQQILDKIIRDMEFNEEVGEETEDEDEAPVFSPVTKENNIFSFFGKKFIHQKNNDGFYVILPLSEDNDPFSVEITNALLDENIQDNKKAAELNKIFSLYNPINIDDFLELFNILFVHKKYKLLEILLNNFLKSNKYNTDACLLLARKIIESIIQYDLSLSDFELVLNIIKNIAIENKENIEIAKKTMIILTRVMGNIMENENQKSSLDIKTIDDQTLTKNYSGGISKKIQESIKNMRANKLIKTKPAYTVWKTALNVILDSYGGKEEFVRLFLKLITEKENKFNFKIDTDSVQFNQFRDFIKSKNDNKNTLASYLFRYPINMFKVKELNTLLTKTINEILNSRYGFKDSSKKTQDVFLTPEYQINPPQFEKLYSIAKTGGIGATHYLILNDEKIFGYGILPKILKTVEFGKKKVFYNLLLNIVANELIMWFNNENKMMPNKIIKIGCYGSSIIKFIEQIISLRKN